MGGGCSLEGLSRTVACPRGAWSWDTREIPATKKRRHGESGQFISTSLAWLPFEKGLVSADLVWPPCRQSNVKVDDGDP